MIPAASPAIGANAIAACSGEVICVMPSAFRVAAVVVMIANITNTPENIPTRTSPRMARIWLIAASGISLDASTSSAACQKNRYGEIVVPAIAIMAAISKRFQRISTLVSPVNTWPQSTFATTRTATYVSSERQSHLKTLAY